MSAQVNVKKIQKKVQKMPKAAVQTAVKTGKQLNKKIRRILVKKNSGSKKAVMGGICAAVAVLAGVACVIAAIIKSDADADLFAADEE